VDWFEWKFLGKLTDPVCGHSWYADSVIYTKRQLDATFEMVRRCAKYFNSGVSGQGAWFGKLLGGFMGLVLGLGMRLPYAVLMVPIQAVVRSVNQKGTLPPAAAPDEGEPKAKGQSA
jgi:hypothetical protein